MTQIVETIDNIPEDVLIHIIRNANEFSWNFLAIKIILTRLNLKILMHKDHQSVKTESCKELRNLLKKSINVPNSRSDIKQILSLVE